MFGNHHFLVDLALGDKYVLVFQRLQALLVNQEEYLVTDKDPKGIKMGDIISDNTKKWHKQYNEHNIRL